MAAAQSELNSTMRAKRFAHVVLQFLQRKAWVLLVLCPLIVASFGGSLLNSAASGKPAPCIPDVETHRCLSYVRRGSRSRQRPPDLRSRDLAMVKRGHRHHDLPYTLCIALEEEARLCETDGECDQSDHPFQYGNSSRHLRDSCSRSWSVAI